MNKPAAHTRSWETAETILGAALLLGLILGYFAPLPLSRWLPRAVTVIGGIMLLVIGFAIVSTTRRQFHQAGQPTDPGHPTTQLMTTGIFSWSRNPLYLAGMVLFLGLGALLNSLWLIILTIPVMLAFYGILILPEERYLEARFGEPYRRYLHSVRRWVGRFRG